MGALTSLNLAGNAIGGHRKIVNGLRTFIVTPEGIAALSPLYIPHAPFLISLLTSGPAAIANAIKDMRAISQFTFSDVFHDTPVTIAISMTEADFSAKGLDSSGAIMVAAFLPKCT
jgi:hypothetical protein